MTYLCNMKEMILEIIMPIVTMEWMGIYHIIREELS